MPDVITIDLDSDDTTIDSLVDMETYLAETECCVNVNGDISPTEEWIPSSETYSTKAGETLDYFGKLKKLASHLADISSVTLKEQWNDNYSDDDIQFSNLVFDCSNELMGLGEYLLDLAKSM